MNNILLVHFKRFGDLVSTGHLVSAIKSQFPHTDISLICFEEFSPVCKLIPGLKKVYSIKRESLLTLTKGQLYNTGFAIDELRARVLAVSKENWDSVINLSNDKASSHFCSWIASHNDKTQIKGIKVDSNNTAVASDFWALVYNDVLTRAGNNSPFNFRDIWTHMFGVEAITTPGLLTNPKNEETVSANFSKIRESQGKIVGIQVHCSVEDKGFNNEFTTDLCDQLSIKKLTPVLIVAPNETERARAKIISDHCFTRPVIIECDFTALSSVVRNLDILVTPDTVTKHFADAWNTPALEISLGSSPTFKQATMNSKSLLMIPSDGTLNSLSMHDVLVCVNAILSNNASSAINTSTCCIYSPINLSGQTVYQTRSQCANEKTELDRHAISLLLNNIANINETNSNEITDIALSSIHDVKRAKEWAADAANSVNNQTREVLHAIRSLLQLKESPKKANAFVEALDRLLQFTDQLSTATVSAIIFRSKLESLPPSNFIENAKMLEALLFEYKANLQTSLKLVQEWDAGINNSRMDYRLTRQPNV